VKTQSKRLVFSLAVQANVPTTTIQYETPNQTIHHALCRTQTQNDTHTPCRHTRNAAMHMHCAAAAAVFACQVRMCFCFVFVCIVL